MNDNEDLKGNLKRWLLILGVAQILVGCLVGLTPPTAVPWFRGVVMAHLEFTSNGVLMAVVGLLLPEVRLPRGLLHLIFWGLQVGTWVNAASGLVAGFSGHSTRLLATTNRLFPPPGGADSTLATGMLIAAGLAIIVALALTLVGLIRSKG